MQREQGVPCKKEARESLWRGKKSGCGKFWEGKRGCGNKGLPVKKEAVGNSGEKEAAGTRGSGVKKEAVGNFGEKEAAGTRDSQCKKRLWKILGKKKLREQGVPL